MARRPNRTSIRPGNAALSQLKRDLRKMPETLAHDVSQAAAPEMTTLTQQAYTSGQTVYGEPRPLGTDGQPLTLHLTGATQSMLRFAASGRIMRAVLAKPYMRYLIGKYRVLPNGPLPVAWSRRLDETFDRVKTTRDYL